MTGCYTNLLVVTVYGLDLFPGQGGAATATVSLAFIPSFSPCWLIPPKFNLLRCILGAVSVSVVQIINTSVGAGWTFVILSGVALAGTPLPLIVLKYGPEWRIRRWRTVKLKQQADRVLEMRRLEALSAEPPEESVKGGTGQALGKSP